MKIEKILAEGETIVYRPKLSWTAYLNLARLVRNLTTTIFLSNKRFYYQHGLLRRTTHEMVVGKIETIDVQETLMGRIMGYGRVYLSGTGAGSMTMRQIKNPFELQRQIRSVQ